MIARDAIHRDNAMVEKLIFLPCQTMMIRPRPDNFPWGCAGLGRDDTAIRRMDDTERGLWPVRRQAMPRAPDPEKFRFRVRPRMILGDG